MINLRNSPFLWFAIMLLISLRVADLIGPCNYLTLVLLWGFSGLCCLLSLLKYLPQHQFVSSIVIGALIFVAGILRFGQFNKDVFAGNLSDQPVYLQGIVKVDQVLKNKN